MCHHTLTGDFILVAPWSFLWGLQVILMPQGAWGAHADPANNSATFYHFIDAASGANDFKKRAFLCYAGMQWAGKICLILVFKPKGVLSLLGWDRLGLPIFAITCPSRRLEYGSPLHSILVLTTLQGGCELSLSLPQFPYLWMGIIVLRNLGTYWWKCNVNPSVCYGVCLFPCFQLH